MRVLARSLHTSGVMSVCSHMATLLEPKIVVPCLVKMSDASESNSWKRRLNWPSEISRSLGSWILEAPVSSAGVRSDYRHATCHAR
jgi:hypothetical protein